MKQKVELSRTLLVLSGLLVLVVGFIAGTRSQQIYALVGPAVGIKVSASTLDLASVQQTYRTLKTHYNGTLSDTKLIEGANRGLVEAVGDPYTVYFNKKEAATFEKELSGDIGGGIGAEIGIRNKQPTIIRTLDNNPAEKAGLKAGDTIVAVNDQSVVGWKADRTVTAIKGDPDTTVKITIKRQGETKTFSITRAIINNPSVTSRIDGNVGTITVSRFDSETASLARKAAESFQSKGVKRVVLDLRGNGGGYLDAAPGVAGLWLDNTKTVVSVKSTGGDSRALKAEGDPILKGLPTVVLVDGYTASAAEIVAGALKDDHVATLVGKTTFGKGTVQEIVSLANGARLKVTIKRWYTPDGRNINKHGITPDIKVKLTQKDLDADQDPQRARALQVLRDE